MFQASSLWPLVLCLLSDVLFIDLVGVHGQAFVFGVYGFKLGHMTKHQSFSLELMQPSVLNAILLQKLIAQKWCVILCCDVN